MHSLQLVSHSDDSRYIPVTSFQVWAGVDSRSVSSLNIVSDSRISWGEHHRWDQGRKVYAAQAQPHIAGYWGDVAFPALALPQFLDQVNFGLLEARSTEEWKKLLVEKLRGLWRTYPDEEKRNFGVAHGYRLGSGMRCQFGLTILSYNRRSDRFNAVSVSMPSTSAILHIEGSGASSLRTSHIRWNESEHSGTSRAAFAGFCDSIQSGEDPYTGGSPQIVSLYRDRGGQMIGTVTMRKRHFGGAPIDKLSSTSPVEWRNELFERVDGQSKRRLPGAQRHKPL